MLLTELLKKESKNWSCEEYDISDKVNAYECTTLYKDFELSTVCNYGKVTGLNSKWYQEFYDKIKELLDNGILNENNTFVEIMFTINKEKDVEYHNSVSITNLVKNDVFSVLSIILNKIKQDIRKFNPDIILFDSKNDEKSRISLYERLINLYSADYQKIYSYDIYDSRYYILIKRNLLKHENF